MSSRAIPVYLKGATHCISVFIYLADPVGRDRCETLKLGFRGRYAMEDLDGCHVVLTVHPGKALDLLDTGEGR